LTTRQCSCTQSSVHEQLFIKRNPFILIMFN